MLDDQFDWTRVRKAVNMNIVKSRTLDVDIRYRCHFASRNNVQTCVQRSKGDPANNSESFVQGHKYLVCRIGPGRPAR